MRLRTVAPNLRTNFCTVCTFRVHPLWYLLCTQFQEIAEFVFQLSSYLAFPLRTVRIPVHLSLRPRAMWPAPRVARLGARFAGSYSLAFAPRRACASQKNTKMLAHRHSRRSLYRRYFQFLGPGTRKTDYQPVKGLSLVLEQLERMEYVQRQTLKALEALQSK